MSLKLEQQEDSLPPEWDRVAIEDICTLGGGKTPRKSNDEYWGGTTPWVSPKDFDGVTLDETEDNLTESGLSDNSINLYEDGDIAMVVRSGVLSHSLPVAQLSSEMAVNQDIKVLQPDTEKITSDYLLNILLYEADRIRASCAKTGTTVESIETAFLKAYKLPLPPLPEQRRIADILSTVDKYINETAKTIEEYRKLSKGFLQDALSQGLTKSDTRNVEIPISPRTWTIPKDWEIRTISEVTTKITDGVHQTPDYVEDGIPFLKAGDLRKESYVWEQFPQISQEAFNSQRFTAKRGDVLLAKNGSPKTIGITKLVNWDTEFSFFVSICLLRPQTDQITPRYLQAALMSKIVKNQITNLSQTGTVTNLHLEEIRSISIPIPPIPEQKEIVDIWQKIEERILQEKEAKDRLEDLKRGLMQDLLTGNKRVNTN